jgi:hypothetical protein
MKKSEWSDHELEQLLQQMPKVKDHRDPRDIYQSLSLKAKKRKAPVWIVPSVASLAAVLLLFILAPQVWQGNFQDSATKQESKEVTDDRSNKMELTKINPVDDTKNGISNGNDISIMAAPVETAIYEEDVMEQQVITYAIPDQNAQILVPVSVLVPTKNKSWLELYQSQAEKLTEVQWGLSDYFPLNATLSMVNEQTLNVDVPEDHVYGNGSASETLFIRILEETMSRNENLQKVTFSTNGNPGIMLGNYGELPELIKPEINKRPYFIFNPNSQNSPFIVPGEVFSDIRTALESMRVGNETYGLKPSIPTEFVFDINEGSPEQLILTFTGKEQLTDESKYVYSIEAILLTAKEFGYKSVKFENSPIPQIGRFNMENEIKVPVAPNKVILP